MRVRSVRELLCISKFKKKKLIPNDFKSWFLPAMGSRVISFCLGHVTAQLTPVQDFAPLLQVKRNRVQRILEKLLLILSPVGFLVTMPAKKK